MPIQALLSIDGGKSLNDATVFEVQPQIGDKIRYWRDGRERVEATVKSYFHQQTESGYALVIEASSDADFDARTMVF